MPVDERHLRAEGLDDQVGQSPRDRKDARVATTTMQGDGSLQEVPCAVQLVALLKTAEAFLAGGPLHVGVEVTIGFLHVFKEIRDLGQHLCPLAGTAAADLPADRLERLVEIRVREPEAQELA